jgi:hypothetical protein
VTIGDDGGNGSTTPGRVPRAGGGAPSATAALGDGDDPAAVLEQLAKLDVVVAGRPLTDVIRPAYDAVVGSAERGIGDDPD